MIYIGFFLLIALGLYVACGGFVLLLAITAGFGSRAETFIGLVITAIGCAILWFAFANAPFQIIAR